MGLVDNRSDMVVHGLDSNGASGPSRQGDNQSADVVPLVVPLVVRLGLPQVQHGLVALGVVVPTALLTRLACKLVAAGVWPERGEKGQEGDGSWLRSLAETCTNILPLPE